MGLDTSIEKKNSFIIICPECLEKIPLFKIIPPFIFYWCKCFRENKSNNLLDICQYKKLTYKKYIESIKSINFTEIDINSLSEITYCEAHPNNKEEDIGIYSLIINCQKCKNPGETYIKLEEYYINLKNKLIENINKDQISILENENYLICNIYQILIKSLLIKKIINRNIIQSLEFLIKSVINDKEKNNLKELSEQIENYIPIEETIDMDSIKGMRFKLNKTHKLINIEQTLSDSQVYEKKIGNGKVYNILFFNEEEKKENIIYNNYSVIILFSIGNYKRGDTRCSLSKFSLFPFKEIIKYKNINNRYSFSSENLSLSKHFKNGFICFGNSANFFNFDCILIYSINSQTPINSIKIMDKYILLKSLLFSPDDEISFLYLFQDKEDNDLQGGVESGHKYIHFYNQKGDLITKDTINNIFHGNFQISFLSLCLYIKNKKVVVIIFKMITYNNQMESKIYIVFYDLSKKSYNLLTNKHLKIYVEDKNNEYYILSICCNDEYLFIFNSENCIEKWDCENATCVEKIKIIMDIYNSNKLLNLLMVNDDLSKVMIIHNEDICYYFKNGNNLLEEIKYIFDDKDKEFMTICNIDFEDMNNNFLFIKNKKFYLTSF